MSTISKKQFKQYIEEFDFTGLFNQLGWTYLDEQTPVKLKEETFLFHSVAEKGGFRIMVFKPSKHQDLPDYATRLQVDRKIGKLFREHLIIFCDKSNTTQIWQLFVKQLGKPSRLSETRWHKGQEPELLYQKTSNLFFTLDQEENITIADVVDVVNENFSKNVEQVTKKFYENFRKEHKKFIDFIKGISVVADREWYASLMLNRLMFCYFIQKKGFLDSNLNYLKDKLSYSQNKKGKDKFYVSFYKNFLLALFHQGLGSPDQTEELKKEIGKIPYLNGGLFDVHELERQYEQIDISDKAFENIFYFFDQYNWHLDTRIDASGKDINPDVIGYIFEKYINDRAQMGAYYTKEDITDYISKNCIIPFLFDETERKYPKAFKSNGTLSEVEVWQMLKESGDTYIYDAVKKGVDLPLPEEIETGIDTTKPNLIERRKEWNKSAPEEYALPTEIWREVVDRRKRYTEIMEKIEKGEITHINDFITYNLNIRQFTQDIIDNHSDPDFIRYFYEALSKITIIDPTCGSGAFLFAAMNILEPIYESCIQRMENFVEEAPKGKYARFEEILKYVKAPEHPNLKYFVFKNIILRNLYGVDIMKEAVEIAKLRLFLKLVATVDADYKKPNLGLEPLPDIDFNIRSGNTLVGFATEKELEKSLIEDLMGAIVKTEIEEKCDIVARTFFRYKEIQLKNGEDYKDFKNAKDELNKRLDELNLQLNHLLHKQAEGIIFDTWLQTHQPFHWFAEFYEIIHDKKGFDVIIGNPPYVEYSKVRDTYKIINYLTEKCGNLYPYVIERNTNLINSFGFLGQIIPLSSFCTQRMDTLVNLIKNEKRNTWVSHYGWRPATLFEGVNIPLSILLCASKSKNRSNFIYTSEFYKWYQEKRIELTSLVRYTNTEGFLRQSFVIPKIPYECQSIFMKLFLKKSTIGSYLSKQGNELFYRNTGGLYWRIILDFQPNFILNGVSTTSSTLTSISFENKEYLALAVAVLNSNLFWLFYTAYSSFHHVNPIDLTSFPVSLAEMDINLKKRLITSGKRLMDEMNLKSKIQTRVHKGGNHSKSQTFYPSQTKNYVDDIDMIIKEHYGFEQDELDRIINYDIKFRLLNTDNDE